MFVSPSGACFVRHLLLVEAAIACSGGFETRSPKDVPDLGKHIRPSVSPSLSKERRAMRGNTCA
ncbi:hypothetical protein GPL17_26550 [Bradyrhizobium yuanmingense]|uniref:hypothetical protein n=1 Tax=Bradyrhizobium yuanmingense TaxID=108015 RepID=UPI0012FC0284|nr:hypothetical protein [Bradyrhizobium yuanmingense]MVT54038.1 hypothetical protein [Bradyrhizobium yuanmingense]